MQGCNLGTDTGSDVPATPGGILVALSTDSSAASVSPTLTVPSGSTTAQFTIGTSPVSSQTTATISANYGAITKTAALSIVSVTALSSITAPKQMVSGGTSSTAVVKLTGAAPEGGLILSLASSDQKTYRCRPVSRFLADQTRAR